ncbi:MAG: division/cell wall cluster transcriptional repressor MraZ [Desulfobacterales bacterium GWB2_56_26]|nr:MAG: division/cell wall cluster transcriptional repressor MraZ [Desulfobacterales bacterium GWB2_56_26]
MAKGRFRSRSEHILDAKGRLNFPSRFRDVLRQSGPEILMVAPWKDHLRAYPLAEWEALETKLLSQGGEPDIVKFVRYVVGGVVECSLDKQGRILLPPDLRSDANLTKEVILSGMIDWVEIWDKAALLAENDTARNGFEDFKASLSRMGIL